MSGIYGPTSPPPAGHLANVCQVANPSVALPCPATEGQGRGYRCEMVGPHDRHRIGEHTIRHDLAGNLYACSAITDEPPAVRAYTI